LADAVVRREAAESAWWRKQSVESAPLTYAHNDPLQKLGYNAATLVAEMHVIERAAAADELLSTLTPDTIPDDLDDVEEAVEALHDELPELVKSALYECRGISMLDAITIASRLRGVGRISNAENIAVVLYLLCECASHPRVAKQTSRVDDDTDVNFDLLYQELKSELLEDDESEDD